VIAGDVDHGVELPPPQLGEITGAITDHRLELRIETGIGAAAIEKGHLVTGAQRGIDNGTPDESGAAQDKQMHCSLLPSR
jgi:hypothetical protein